MNKKPFRILAGSLRQGSYNRGLLRAAAELAPEWVEVQFFDIGTLPFFNEDVEATALDQLVREGKIRYVGVSNYDVKQMQAFEQVRKLDSLQPPYSLFRRDIEQDILPYTRQHGIGVLVYGALAHGLLAGGFTPQTRFTADDWRSKSPIFHGENFQRNLAVVNQLKRLAEREGMSVA